MPPSIPGAVATRTDQSAARKPRQHRPARRTGARAGAAEAAPRSKSHRAAALQPGDSAAALRLSQISLRGIDISEIPLSIPLNETAKTGEAIARLIEGGLLPALAPAEHETAAQYLQRVSKARNPVERDLSLEFHADSREQFPYQLTGHHRVACESHTLEHLARFLNAQGALLLPSLLLAIQKATHPAYPVYTTLHALEYLSNRYWWYGNTPEVGFREWFLEEVEQEELDTEQEEHYNTHPYNPANVRTEVGMAMFELASNSQQYLSTEELWSWSEHDPFILPELLSRITALQQASLALSRAEPEDWNHERYTREGEGMAPLAAFSVQNASKSYTYGTLEFDVLEEEHQLYMMGEGHCPQLWASVANPEEVALTRQLIALHEEVCQATKNLITALIYADDLCALEEA